MYLFVVMYLMLVIIILLKYNQLIIEFIVIFMDEVVLIYLIFEFMKFL
jgi:hypothetical protein